MYPLSIVQKWYEEYGINSHHIDSFNNFMYHGIRTIIRGIPISFTTTKGVNVSITIDNIYIPQPYIYDENRKKIILTPQDCRRKGLTYSSPVYVSVTETKDNMINTYDRLVLCNIPIMLRSNYCINSKFDNSYGECMNDPGGYFVINGIDRVLVTQRRNTYNQLQVYNDNNSKFSYKAEMRSMSDDTNHSVLVQATICKNGCMIHFTIPYIKSTISFATILKSMDISWEQVVEFMIKDIEDKKIRVHIERSVKQSYRQISNLTSSECLEMIGSSGTKIDNQNKKEYARQVLEVEMFPHLGVYSSARDRVELILYIVKKLYQVYFEILKPHEKDDLAFKRFETSGVLLYELFKSLYRSTTLDIETDYEKGIGIIDIFNKIDTTITKNIKYCFSTGKWGVQRNSYIRQGVSQVLNRLSYIGMISHLQRVVIPVGKEGKNFHIRQINPSSFGYICLYETPEGQSCGIVLNLTITTRISENYSTKTIRNIVMRFIQTSCCDDSKYIIFLNGFIIAKTEQPEEVMKILLDLRRRTIIPHDVSLAYDRFENEIRILSDKGRLIRPFLTTPTTEWFQGIDLFSDAVREGFIVWLDANEVQTLIVGMYPHECADVWEIHPSLLLGACSGCIPFSDHNQSPRNVYESSMMKQSIGMFATNYNSRYDSFFHTLDYPQKSLVSTHTARLIGCHEMPAGINCIVAICTYGGWNAEDSVIINRSAIERGLFCSNTYHTYTFEDKTYKKENNIKICIPPSDIQKKEYNYYHLDQNGLVKKGAYVSKYDVIIGKVQTQIEYKDNERIENITDCSELPEHEGIIDRVETFISPTGNKIIQIVLRIVRIPEIGDKFANMAAQKGTCALILSQEDMPFTGEGIVPDLIMNAHALPSRMTISMVLEMVLGKKCLLKGELGDATPFSENSINAAQILADELVKHGYERNGWEVMYNGYTGEPFHSAIFIGPSYYQKLKHMVSEKLHARSYGNVTSLTRQPLAGRSKDGGLRLGEMEKDALLAHGSVQFLRERLFDMSDPFSVLICNNCGVVSNDQYECHICSDNNLARTNIPYAAKLLFQMLNGCLIETKFSSEQD